MKLMSRLAPAIAFVLLLLLPSTSLFAWSYGGHMTVAYIAYKNLTPKTRAKVDALLKLNPMYKTWTTNVPAAQQPLVAFVYAATWPDCIKQTTCAPGYTSDGPDNGDTPPGNPTDAQNIGYKDHLMHKYWHFEDLPYEAGAAGKPSKDPNVVTEIQLLTAALSAKKLKGIKSYDIAWLEHLVGDVHQPLHATSRFTKNHPDGDAGGNFVAFCVKPCRDELHAYWDGLLGAKLSIKTISATGDQLLAESKPDGTDVTDPTVWANESFELAKSAVYVTPISDDNDPDVKISPRPDDAYAAKVKEIARARVLLAGYRLANLLNTNLK